jgi:hypothetical protein
MKLGKALSTGYAEDAYEDGTGEELVAPAGRTDERTAVPEPVEATAEATRPRQVVDAAAR